MVSMTMWLVRTSALTATGNYYGQVGNNTTTDSNVPVTVSDWG